MAHGEAGAKTLDEVVDAIRRDLPEVDRDTIADAIVAFSRRPPVVRNKDEIKAAIADLKRTARMDADTRAKIKDLQSQLSTGEIKLPEPRNKKVYDERLESLRFQRDKLRKKINQEIDKTKEKSAFKTFVAAPFEEFRALMTTGELSAVLRQGGFFSIANPVSNTKAALPMLKALKSEKVAHKIDQSLRPGNENSRPNAMMYEKSGLHLPDPEIVDNPKKSEEAFQTDLPITGAISRITRIPVDKLVHGFGRAYITFLNLQRADTFDAMAGSLAKYGEPTLQEAKAISKFINVATGRASLGKAEAAVSALNTAFFAPRYVLSRFQLLAELPRAALAQVTNPAIKAFNKVTGKNVTVPDRHLFGGTAETDKLIAEQYANYAVGITTILTLLSYVPGVEIEKDPRSTDFGKIRVGNTRADLFSGLQQVAVFLAKQGSGKTKSTKTGQIEEMDAGDRLDNATRFVRGKLSPLWSSSLDVLLRENIVGDRVAPLRSPTDAAQFATKLLTPIAYQDIYKILKSDYSMPDQTALTVSAILGAGIQSYDPGKIQPPDDRFKTPKAEREANPALGGMIHLNDSEYAELMKAHEEAIGEVEKSRKAGDFKDLTLPETREEEKAIYDDVFGPAKEAVMLDALSRLSP